MSSSEAVPVCYRHTDRETYVHCVRCDRPICPDCMRDAAVGFQCVECVKEGAKAVRAMSAPYETKKVRSINEARARQASSNALSTVLRGNVTKILVGINVLVFVVFQDGLSAGISNQTSNKFTADFEMLGHAQYFDGSVHGVAQGEYYRLVTAAFLHANILHIAFNMFALWQLGTVLERLLGTWRYLTLYFVGAIGGNTLSYVVHGAATASVGASTALFAMFGAFYLLVRKVGGDTSQIVSLIVLNLVMTFFLSSIDKFGHIGGLIAGGLVGLVLTRIPTTKPQLQALLCGAIAAGCVVAAVLTTASIT